MSHRYANGGDSSGRGGARDERSPWAVASALTMGADGDWDAPEAARARRERREAARARLRRQRRLAGAGALALLGLVAIAVGGLGGSGRSGGGGERSRRAAAAPPAPEVPRGGRTILPAFRVVAYYGAPQDAQLGQLGIGSPDQAARMLARQARPYAQPRGRPVLPAFELLATVAAHAPGPDGRYRTIQPDAVIRRYLAAARRHHLLLILDLQPGYEPFMTEVRRLRRYLEQPDVSLALDPEWSLRPPNRPGQVIGSTDASVVNETSAYLADIVRRRNLPQKLLLVHQFTDGMINHRRQLVARPGVALTLNVDGFGGQAVKIAKYRALTQGERRFHNGFKLFDHEDSKPMISPRRALRLHPSAEVFVYE